MSAVKNLILLPALQLDTKSIRQRQGWTLDKLIGRICSFCEIEEQLLLTKARDNNLARAKSLICFWGVEELGFTSSALSLRLGISQQAVSKWVKKGRAYTDSMLLSLDDLACQVVKL